MKLKIEIKVDSLSRIELENLGQFYFFTNPTETTGWVNISGVNEFWTLRIIAEKLGTYERLNFSSWQGANSIKLRIYFYERDFTTPTRFKDLDLPVY